jgi:hypothetical protein
MSNTSIPALERDDFDGIVDEVLAAAGGDVRRAIIGLVLGQHELESRIQAIVSAGYVRRN